MIEELIKRQIPFAILKSYSWVLNIPKKVKVYEILLYDKKTKGIITRKLTKIERKELVKNVSKFTLKHNSEDGCIYEFMNFKEHFGFKKGIKPKKCKQPKKINYRKLGETDDIIAERKREIELKYQEKLNKEYFKDYEGNNIKRN